VENPAKTIKKSKTADAYIRIIQRMSGAPYSIADLLMMLDVHWSAPMPEIRHAWRLFAGVMHPDKHGGDPEKTEIFREFLSVYDQIKTESDFRSIGSEMPIYDLEKNIEELIHIYVGNIRKNHEQQNY
jgi:hypothetical protein